MSYDSCVDIDTISQISAMDSASQTGGGSMVDSYSGGGAGNGHKFHKQFSCSDSNIPR